MTQYEQLPRKTRVKGYDHNGNLGKYTWLKTADNHWRLGLLSYIDYEDEVENDVFTRELVVTSFEAPMTFPESHFTLAGLNAPEGTRVEETGGGKTRRYTIGKADQTSDTKLDELAKKARDKGFAKPKR